MSEKTNTSRARMSYQDFQSDAYYGYRVNTTTPLRSAVLMQGRMNFEHEHIKLHTFCFQTYEDMIDGFDEDMFCLVFGFSVKDKSAEEFFALKQTLDAYMKDATFKGKELFQEPRFIASISPHYYWGSYEDGRDLDDEDDVKEYELYAYELKNKNIVQTIHNLDKAIAQWLEKKETSEGTYSGKIVLSLQKQKERLEHDLAALA